MDLFLTIVCFFIALGLTQAQGLRIPKDDDGSAVGLLLVVTVVITMLLKKSIVLFMLFYVAGQCAADPTFATVFGGPDGLTLGVCP